MGDILDKFDEHEVCPVCGNDPIESGLKWKPRFVPRKVDMDYILKRANVTDAHMLVTCGQCKYQVKRACLNEV